MLLAQHSTAKQRAGIGIVPCALHNLMLLDRLMHLWMLFSASCWCPIMLALLNKVQATFKPRSSPRCMHEGQSCCMPRMQVLLDRARANSKAADPATRIPNGSLDGAGTRTAGTHLPVLTQKSKSWLEWLDAKLFTDKADAWLKLAHTKGMQEYKDEVTICQDVCCHRETPIKQSPSSLRALEGGRAGNPSWQSCCLQALLPRVGQAVPAESHALFNRSNKASRRCCGTSDAQLALCAGTS